MATTARHVVAATVGGLALLSLSAPAGAQVDPPGNNGTVKIDGVDFDDHPDNEPHPGCEFQVDFYGFDEGDLEATVTFAVIPPSGDDVDILDDLVDIGEDPAGGGTDLDASASYDLTDLLSNVVPHPQQGIHLKLTVHAEGSQGADTKFKVFWVTGCGAPPPTTTSSTTSTTQPTSTTEKPGGTTTSIKPGETTIPGGSTTTPGPTPGPDGPDDDGVSPATTVTSGELPRTGSTIAPFVVAGLVLATLGVAAGVTARRLRAGGQS